VETDYICFTANSIIQNKPIYAEKATLLDTENMFEVCEKMYLAISTVMLLTVLNTNIWHACGLKVNERSADYLGKGSPVIIRMSDKRQDGRYSLIDSDSENQNLNDLLRAGRFRMRRVKRNENGKVIVNVNTLSDEGHNEAVVHWSGKKSQVFTQVLAYV